MVDYLSRQPLVSVIIPTYKRPQLLKRAVDSVKRQTYDNIEIIVIDDANDPEVFKLYGNCELVTLLINETNKGGGYSRNRGITLSKGEFINFLDDDDILYPEKISKQITHFLDNPNNIDNLGFITCNAHDERTGERILKRNNVRGNIHKKLLYKFMISGIETVLYKRKFLIEIEGFDEELVSSQEYDLLIRVSSNCNVDFVDEYLSKEFNSVNQITLNLDKKLKGSKQLYNKYKKIYSNYGVIFNIKTRLKYNILFSKFYMGKLFGLKFYLKYLR